MGGGGGGGGAERVVDGKNVDSYMQAGRERSTQINEPRDRERDRDRQTGTETETETERNDKSTPCSIFRGLPFPTGRVFQSHVTRHVTQPTLSGFFYASACN